MWTLAHTAHHGCQHGHDCCAEAGWMNQNESQLEYSTLVKQEMAKQEMAPNSAADVDLVSYLIEVTGLRRC